jgi:hypothetical protein
MRCATVAPTRVQVQPLFTLVYFRAMISTQLLSMPFTGIAMCNVPSTALGTLARLNVRNARLHSSDCPRIRFYRSNG